MKIDWINGFKAGNKKEKYQLEFRLGTFTVLEIKLCSCSETNCTKFRFMFLNLNLYDFLKYDSRDCLSDVKISS